MYIVFRCTCGRHLYALQDAKTRTCPCGKRTNLRKAKVLAQAEDARSAGEIVRRLQMGGQEMRGFRQAGGD
ncbi:MAG: hypothetical protein A4E48_01172 [Methanosaeta sp. PtaU1.Bin060]|nr:MAG: hypothetical protein A4E48_01172 [Methanosaeta sp. PtaU1.Bin060]